MDTVGQRIRAARIAANVSQAQLAERVGIAQAAISRIERDETHDPGVLIVAGIAHALEITVDQLVAGNERLRTPRRSLEERVGALERRVTAIEDRETARAERDADEAT